MSLPNQIPYNIYTANGLSTVFTYEFYLIAANDLQVSVNGEIVSTGYTTSGVGNVSGGDVTFLTPPENGSMVMLERVVPTFRLTEYQDNGDLLADTVNKDFDRLWMAIQHASIHLGLALRRPLFGGPYNAEGYRVANLGYPTMSADAASKKYVDDLNAYLLQTMETAIETIKNGQYGYITKDSFEDGSTLRAANECLRWKNNGEYYRWDGAFPKVVPPGSTPDSAGGIGKEKWVGVGDASLRNDLKSTAAGRGDALIGVKQPYAGSVGTTQHEINKLLVSIVDFGGKGDGVFDNAAALQNASAAVGNDGVIYFPISGGGNYRLGDSTAASWTDNRILKTDPGVMLSCTDGGHIGSSVKCATEIRVHYTNQDVYFYYPQSTGVGRADRPMWLSSAERDISTLDRVYPNSSDMKFGMYYRTVTNSSDSILPTNPLATSENGYVFASAGTGSQQIGFSHLSDGEELSAIFDGPNSGNVYGVVTILCSSGRVWYTCKADGSSQVGKNIKPTGESIISGPVAYQGMDTAPYNFFMSDLTIRRNSSISFTLMANGFVVDTVDVSSLGEITDIGYGVTGEGQLTVSNITRRTCAPRDNGRFLHACCFGDSISADSMGASWPSVLRSSLDGMNGVRFANVDNYAVAGDDSAAQRKIMDSVNLGNYNLCLIMLGVNDIQGGVAVSTYIANMRYMINKTIASGNQVIVACPTMFYGQDQTGGKGQPTSRSGEGKWYRSAIRNLCAELSVKFIEMNQVIGPVFSSYVAESGFPKQDSTVSDNIHPTGNTSYLFARAFYNAICGLMQPGASVKIASEREVGGTPADGWNVTVSDIPRWSRDSSGTISLDGLIFHSGAAPANGSLVYTLPSHLRPRLTTRQVVWADAVNARIIIDPDGSIKVFGMTSGDWLSLGGISFKGLV